MFRSVIRHAFVLLLAIVLGASGATLAVALSADPVPNDNDIEGANVLATVDATGSDSVSEWASGSSDQHDIYAVWIEPGESLNATLSAGGDGWHLRLYDVGTETINMTVFGAPPTSPLADVTGPAPLVQNFSPTIAGYYYLDVFANGVAEGVYQLDVAIAHPSADVVITSMSRTLSFGTTPLITGRVQDRFGRPVPASGKIILSYSFDGLDWMPLSSQAYDGLGFSLPGLAQWRKTSYMVTFLGADGFGPSAQTTAAYPTHVYWPMSVDADVYTWRKGAYYYAYGQLAPTHPTGSKPVRIYKYKRVNGSWRSYGYVAAAISGSGEGLSSYKVRMSLPSAGSWRLRAYAPADSQHVASWSPRYLYITVK